MNKTLNQLENDRKEKIKNLNLDEVKAYITNLNKKVYESFDDNNPEDMKLYESKLKEVFELTNDKYINLDSYSLLRKFEITTSKMIENKTKIQITHLYHVILILTSSHMILNQLYHILGYILMIYYHNYYTKENMLVDDLLAHLHCEYNFNNEEFDEYAHSRVTKYNKTLMRELDSLIEHTKNNINLVIELSDAHFNEDYMNEISSVLKEIEYEKEFVNIKGASDEGVKLLKEGKYLDLLDSMKESYKLYGESCSKYIEIKEDIQKLTNSPDGFSEMKEFDYNFAKKHGLSSSKEDYIASRPSYNVSKCKFIKSG